jgi:AcrR family transcriptional regulator
MPRAGLNVDVITETAARLVDKEGPSALTVARVAQELGVRAPSLYSHLDGLAGLTRAVALEGLGQLAESCRSASMGRSGQDALAALAHAYRAWAVEHPGVYPFTQVARPSDKEHGEIAARVLEPLFVILESFGLHGDEIIHAARFVRSMLHGFSQLEAQHGFALDVEVDQSFEWMLDRLGRALTTPSQEPAKSG